MSGTGSTTGRARRHLPEIAWAVFALANVAVIVALDKWETIPFHFVWVSLTLVYGIRVWRLRPTLAVLAVVAALTGGALLWTVLRGHERLDEIAEVPLMAAMFVAMVWHAERRQAAVEEAERMAETEHRLLERQQEFVRDASHELRTPITVARGHAELVRASIPDPQAAHDIDVIVDELARLSRLSERLLFLAASDQPAGLALQPLEVGPFMAAMVERWEPTADRVWGVSATAEGSLVADRVRLAAAIDALIENAIEATSSGDRICLSAEAVDGELTVSVSDTGIGIAPEHLPRIFERFARADADRSRRSGGTGLGLAMVRAAAEAHGGSVSVGSEPGRGSTFRIRLPRFRASASAPVRVEVAPVGDPSATH